MSRIRSPPRSRLDEGASTKVAPSVGPDAGSDEAPAERYSKLTRLGSGDSGDETSYGSDSDEETSYGSSDSDDESSYGSDSDSDSDSSRDDEDFSSCRNGERFSGVNAAMNSFISDGRQCEEGSAALGLSDVMKSLTMSQTSADVRRNLSGDCLCRSVNAAAPVADRRASIPAILSVPNMHSVLAMAQAQQSQSHSLSAATASRRASSGGEALVHIEQGVPTATSVSSARQSAEVASDPDARTNPSDRLRSVLAEAGYPPDPFVPASDGRLLESRGYFLEHTPEQIASYDTAVTAAVRAGNVAALRAMLRDGRDLQCSNRFGESIVHAACRRGSLAVVRFLLDEAGVSLRVRDDQGRTPLHDACWTRVPEFELVRIIVEREPDLLLVCDKRGHSPLGYVRRDHWGAWVRFLDGHRDLLVPKVLLKPVQG